MRKSSVASSQPVTYARRSAADIKKFANSPEAKAMAEAVKKRGGPTGADLREMPEITDEEWAALKAARRKKPVTVRIDPDIVAWLKGKEGKYQQHLNRTLRFAMQQEMAAKARRKKRVAG